jgi:predicted aspartyl protease
LRPSRRSLSVGAFTAALTASLAFRALAGGDDPATSPEGSSSQGPQVSFDNAARFSGWLPFSLDAASHLLVDAAVNDVATIAIIDSGAGRTIVDREFAKRLQLKSGTAFEAAGVTSNAYGELASGLSVRLGHLVLRDLTVAILDLSILSKVDGKPVDVVIGREVFDRSLVDLNFHKQMIALFDFASVPKAEGAAVLDLVPDNLGRRYVSISICGADDVEACYDLGNDVPLVISPDYADSHDLFAGLRVSSVASAGVSGISLGRVAVLPSVRIGVVTFSNVPVQVPDKWNQSGSVLAGLPIWSRFGNLVDYSRNRLSLTPVANMLAAPFPKDRSGIGAARLNGHLQIIHIAEGSPAERIGLHAGDEIVAIDGHPVDEAYLSSHPHLGVRPAGTVAALTLADGRRLKLVLADYF